MCQLGKKSWLCSAFLYIQRKHRTGDHTIHFGQSVYSVDQTGPLASLVFFDAHIDSNDPSNGVRPDVQLFYANSPRGSGAVGGVAKYTSYIDNLQDLIALNDDLDISALFFTLIQAKSRGSITL